MTTVPARSLPSTSPTIETLIAVERRVLWLATAIVHHANRVRPNPSGLKVGGHQASSASMVTIMTELWFRHLRPQDRVAARPSPRRWPRRTGSRRWATPRTSCA